MRNTAILLATVVGLSACGNGDSNTRNELSKDLESAINALSNGEGLTAYTMPDDGDYTNLPQDPNNPISAEKVALGQMLYHEPGIATAGNNPGLAGTWSCASCHHVAAGFKSGIPQGIAEGGVGFGLTGEGRVMGDGFDPLSTDMTMVPDTQPLASPAVLNTTYQEVMLWNGQFGNMVGGAVNIGLDDDILMTVDTPRAENARQLAGIEIQAVAGVGVHRLNVTDASVLQTNTQYQMLFDAAYPSGSTDVLEDAAKAIAAYERTILANQSPFQRWLKGDNHAMSESELRGANLFFGNAGCADCHRGPALSSEVGAAEDDVFFALGFADFDTSDPQIHGEVGEGPALGRGGFTGETSDNYKFKVPQLYNLADSDIFGHGASFSSVREVIEYKNAAIPQKDIPENLDARFVPLGLSDTEISDLTAFLETGLYDPNLVRYVPNELPTGLCHPVADDVAIADLGCPAP